MIEQSLVRGIDDDGVVVYGYVIPSEHGAQIKKVEEFNESSGIVDVKSNEISRYSGVMTPDGKMIFENNKLTLSLSHKSEGVDGKIEVLDKRSYTGIVQFKRGAFIVKPIEESDKDIPAIYLYGMVDEDDASDLPQVLSKSLERAVKAQDGTINISSYAFVEFMGNTCKKIGVMDEEARENIVQIIEIGKKLLNVKFDNAKKIGELERVLADFRASVKIYGIPDGLITDDSKAKLDRKTLTKKELQWIEKVKQNHVKLLDFMKLNKLYMDQIQEFANNLEDWATAKRSAMHKGLI